MVARLGIILLNNLKTPGAALRAMCFPPFFHLDVSPLRTLNVGMPGTLAADAPAVRAVGTLHHGVAISKQVDEAAALQTMYTFTEHGSIIKINELAVLLAA